MPPKSLPKIEEITSDANKADDKPNAADSATQTVDDSAEAPKDGGYLTKAQLDAVVVVINGVILAQSASPYTLKDAHDLFEACKGSKAEDPLAAGVHAAQRKSPYSLENASALYDAVTLLIQKDKPEESK